MNCRRDDFRGTFPGLAYQLGNLLAANAAQQQAWLAEHFRDASGHAELRAHNGADSIAVMFVAVIVLAAIGPEKRGKEF